MIRDQPQVLADWDAIFEDLVGRYGEGRLAPAANFASANDCRNLHCCRLLRRLDSELSRAFGLPERRLAKTTLLLANALSAAEIQLSCVLDTDAARASQG